AFGPRMDFHIRQGLDERPRQLLWKVEEIAASIEAFLRSMPSVTRVSITGSLRRKQETVGDLNFLVSGKSAASIFKGLTKFGAVQSVEKKGRTQALFHLSSGINISLKWTDESSWGVALIEATGSLSHVQQLVDLAQGDNVPLSF